LTTAVSRGTNRRPSKWEHTEEGCWSIEHEEAVRAFLADYSGDHDADRVERLVSYLAPDARYYVFAWWEPCVGQDAIRSELLKRATASSDRSFELLNFASVGQTAVQ
jgi:hypothetical protein